MIPKDYKTTSQIKRSFFARNTVTVARELIGKKITFRKKYEMPATCPAKPWRSGKAGIQSARDSGPLTEFIPCPDTGRGFQYDEISGIITETEAYVGQDDPACHAARGKTLRNAPMFDRAGTSYVYLIYGMYHCLNFVTEDEDFPAAVLLRGVWLDPDQGGRHLQQNLSEAKVALRNNKKQNLSEAKVALRHLNGPGKLCKHMGITREHTWVDMFSPESPFVFYDTDISLPIAETPRIGIKAGTDKLWRFVMAQNH